MSVRFHRSARISQGKNAEAIAFAQSVTEFINSKYTNTITVFTETFSQAGTVHWFSDYASMAEFEERFAVLLAENDYQRLLQGAVGLFIEGSVTDRLYTQR